ncbi:hypothetical protein R1flu_012613 [Riccia fluitans]|uniref:RRM domain-containing protein n=1 Tax=Riccia fluitans TaxID=41844 RepID=A0ABD1ZB88_9MARC
MPESSKWILAFTTITIFLVEEKRPAKTYGPTIHPGSPNCYIRFVVAAHSYPPSAIDLALEEVEKRGGGSMDSDQGKLFIGGISWETTEEKLRDYFKAYGEVAETVIMKDRATGRARGFGFVIFVDPAVADRVVTEKHTIDGRTVEAKKAVPRDEQQNVPRSSSGGPGPASHTRTKKIFVGGLASTVTEDDFKKYFEQFGTITDVVVMYDHNTQRPRGFGFITFDSEDAVENVLQKSFHELNEKMVEVKRAIPKELSAGPGRTTSGFSGGGRGGSYGTGYGQGYTSSPGAYGGRGDSRYGPAPGGRGGYTGYGAAGYGAAGYGSGGGYASGMNGSYGGSGYGNSAGYGSAGGGGYGAGTYGTAGGGAGYGGAGGYGSGGAGAGGYGGAPVGSRSAWASGGTGYGGGGSSTGYGGSAGGSVSGYGSSGAWASGGGGAGQATGSSYGNTGYGYGSSETGYGSNSTGYGGRGSGYGSSASGYGSSGGGGTGSGSYVGGYGDVYGSSGYADPTWRSGGTDSYNSAAAGSGGVAGGGYSMAGGAAADATVNGSTGYGGGYGVAGRQTQRGPDARFRPYPAAGDRTG